MGQLIIATNMSLDGVVEDPDGHEGFERGEATPGGEHRVLQRVLGVLERAEHPVAVHLQLAAMGLGDFAERLTIAGSSSIDQLGAHEHTSLPRAILR